MNIQDSYIRTLTYNFTKCILGTYIYILQTEHFTILEPQNLAIDELCYKDQKRRSTDDRSKVVNGLCYDVGVHRE